MVENKMSMSQKDLKDKIIEASIDYWQGHQNDGFAQEYGGLEKLKEELFELIVCYQTPDIRKRSLNSKEDV